MTEIEQVSDWALTIAAEAAGTKLHHYEQMSDDNRLAQSIEAHARAIEQHEAFRREVSDAVEHYASRWPANARRDIFMSQFASFIIPKPVDPLVEAFADLGFTDFAEGIEDFRAALAARGLEIREVRP